MQRELNFCVLVVCAARLYDRRLRSCPKSDERRNQQPEQSFHEEEKKTPEAEPFYPLGYGHLVHRAFARKVVASFISGRTESANRPSSTSFL